MKAPKKFLALGGLAALLVLAYFDTPRSAHWPVDSLPRVDAASLDAFLKNAESLRGLVPKTEKHIAWAFADKRKTPLSLVYLHGFSASNQELSPLIENLAADWHANLYMGRFKAHGFPADKRDEFRTVRAEDWLADAAEALAIAKTIGEKTILVGMSTGAIPAMALAAKFPELVDSLVLLSPNMQPHDPRSYLLYMPFMEKIARVVQMGEPAGFKPKNAQHELYCSTKYDLNALTQMARLVKMIEADLLEKILCPTLVVYTEHDRVVSTRAIQWAYGLIGAPQKQLINFAQAKHHVIAGDMLSPETSEPLKQVIKTFFQASLPEHKSRALRPNSRALAK